MELMEEITDLKKVIKDVMKQFTFDFEDQMNTFNDGIKKQNIQSTNALHILTKEVVKTKSQNSSEPLLPPPSLASNASPEVSSKSETEGQKIVKPVTMKKTSYMSKPKVLMIGDSVSQKLNFRKIEEVTNSTIRTAKGYTSGWNQSPNSEQFNITEVTRTQLEKGKFERLVLATPKFDIAEATTNINPGEVIAHLKAKVKESCQNIISVAENSLAVHKSLKNVTIMEHSSHFDTKQVDSMSMKSNLENYANSYLRELWFESPYKNNIYIGSVGKAGDLESVINILVSSFNIKTSPQQRNKYEDDYDHTRCSQAMYMKRQAQKMRLYSSVVSGKAPVRTYNRYSPLNNIPGNW